MREKGAYFTSAPKSFLESLDGAAKKDENVVLAGGGPSGKPQGKGIVLAPVLVICGPKGNQISRAALSLDCPASMWSGVKTTLPAMGVVGDRRFLRPHP